MMAKMELVFDGFAGLAEKIDRMGGNMKSAVDEALLKAQKIVQDNLKEAVAPYAKKGGGQKGYATGKMYRAIINDRQVYWAGDTATVNVGFDLETPGGFHSIFVMYGTPKMSKDTKIYNAIRGKSVQDEISKAQEKILKKHLKLGD